jgi:hypothetical protein
MYSGRKNRIAAAVHVGQAPADDEQGGVGEAEADQRPLQLAERGVELLVDLRDGENDGGRRNRRDAARDGHRGEHDPLAVPLAGRPSRQVEAERVLQHGARP